MAESIIDKIATVIASHDPDADASKIAAEIIAAMPAHCYWDASDREIGFLDINDIVDNYGHGEVFEVEHVGIFKTTHHVTLPPAADSDSDDDWEFEGDTAEEAEQALKAETDRRAAMLWCCHVRGPDDVMACDDKAHAERVAAALIKQFKPMSDQTDVMFDPVAAPWPHSTEAHARDLAKPSVDYAAVIAAARQPASE